MCELTFQSTSRCNNCKDFDDCYGQWEKTNEDELRKQKMFKQESWKDAMRTNKGRGRRFSGRN